MSRVVRNNIGYLQLLTACPDNQKQFLLSTATPEQIHAIVQVIHNYLHGYLPTTEQERRALRPYKEAIYALHHPSKPFKKKKKILVQEGGSFITELLTPFISGLLML